ncbi:MAG: hypothetical protein KGP28_09310 [Bdellovibrionales bacterium]|nr:hypothetical protein [Bdellovibrionales bacterium]
MKLARIAIFLAGVIGITTGGLLSISALKSNQEQELVRTHESLKSQATILVDQFFSILESAKKLNPKTSAELLPYVSQYGTVRLKSGIPEEFESFSINDLALQERVMSALKSQISIGDLGLVKLGLGTFEMNETGGKLGIFLALPVFKTGVSGAIEPETVDKLNLTLIDPVKAMPGLVKLTSGNRDAFLLQKDGRVLAHTRSAYVGADLKRLGDLRDSIANLFLGAQTGFVQRYSQSDGTRQVLAVVRAGVFPFALGVEQRALAPVLSTEWLLEQMDSGSARRGIGVAFILLAIALVLFSLMSAWASRSLRMELARPSDFTGSEDAIPIPESGFIGNRVSDPLTVSSATERFASARAAVQTSQTDLRAQTHSIGQMVQTGSDPVSELLSKIEGALTQETVEKELVQTAASLSRGGAVYFRYQRRMQNLSYQNASCELKPENYHLLQAYVRKDIELQVEQLADSGKVASLTHYGPIKKIIQANFEGTKYEAWAVTSQPEVSLQSRMVGVLVLVNPDQTDASFRPVLARIMKEAGNYLYAHANKIKSRNLTGPELMT